MALRDVNIRLRLDDSQFKAKIAGAVASTKQFGAETTAAGAKGAKSLGLLPSSYATIGLAAGAAAVASVRAAADFEQAMANVAATGAASTGQLHSLRDAALEMGKTTVYSSTEAAGGMEALLKAGLSARDVIGGGLAGSFDLAAAGGLEVAEAAETAAAAMAQFSLTGRDVPHIADLLAAGAGKASGDVRDLGQALNQAGLVAAGAGASIEETTGTLSAFANAGLLGSDAGTSLKTMLQRLQDPAGEAAAKMDALNISAYDANGNFVGLATVAGQLQKAFKDSTQETRNQALATIFGADAVRAANVLYKEGAQGIEGWTAKVNDAGYAADVAAQKTDTLKGDLDQMKNSFRALAEGAGGDGGGFIRPFVQGLGDIADALNEGGDALGDFGLRYGMLRDTIDAHKLGIDTDVYVRFKTEGKANAIKDAAEVARAEGMSDRTVTAILEQKGWSTEGIDLVLERMRQVSERKATALVNILGDKETLAALGGVDAALAKTDGETAAPDINLDNYGPTMLQLLEVASGLELIDESDPSVHIDVETTEAEKKILRVIGLLNDLPSSGKKGGINVLLTPSFDEAEGGAIQFSKLVGLPAGYAWGGRARGAIRGPGSWTSDSIPARLSNGEHVLTASDVRKMGGQEAVYSFRHAVQAGAYEHRTRSFAAGGAVGVPAVPAAQSVNLDVHIRNVTVDERGLLAAMEVVATDVTGRELAKSRFEQVMVAPR